jgi:hypothetical protein
MDDDTKTTFLLIAGFLLLGGAGYTVYTMVRGLRNNNPLNIIDDGTTAWEGLDTPRNDGEAPQPMLRFISPEYGYRAGGIILNNYVSADGVSPTVTDLISRWSATDQAAYIANVAAALGVDPNAPLDLSSQLAPMMAAMTTQENGLNPYSLATITTGLNLA